MALITLTHDHWHGGVYYAAGEVVELPDDAAQFALSRSVEARRAQFTAEDLRQKALAEVGAGVAKEPPPAASLVPDDATREART